VVSSACSEQQPANEDISTGGCLLESERVPQARFLLQNELPYSCLRRANVVKVSSPAIGFQQR
jgi:hypothetical protein